MIFSPSRTEAYDFCSQRGVLAYREGWTPREADNSLIGRIVGSAFAKGTEGIHRGDDLTLSVAAAISLFDRTTLHYATHGVSFSQDLQKVKEQLGKALDKYYIHNPFKTWTLKGVELKLPDHGGARLDVLGIDPEGYWSIADLKYKRSLKLDYLNKTVNEYRDSWQFLHYPWAYNDWVAKGDSLMESAYPPDHDPGYQPVTRMWLILVIADPFKVLTFPFFVKDKLQARWLTSAQQKWADIAAIQSGERQPTMAASHRDGYGDCPFKRACLEMDLDESLMQFEYVKVPKLPDEEVISATV